MKKLILAMALLLYPAVASAQVVIRYGWTAPPPLIEVSPGVQVVEDGGDEIFFTNGRYWVERDGRWYWARDYHENWRFADARRVPVFVRSHRRGEYLHYRRVDHPRAAAIRREEHRERREAVHREQHREAVHREVKREQRHEERREERHEH
jgi:hypothetical protein